MEHNKLVYIACPYSGDVERNVAFAKAACRYAMKQGVTPIASICYIRRCWMIKYRKREILEQVWDFES